MPQSTDQKLESQNHRVLVGIAQERGQHSEAAIVALLSAYNRLIVQQSKAAPIYLREDVRSAAIEGLIRAIERYNPCRGASFKTYATAVVRGYALNAVNRELKHQKVDSIDSIENAGNELDHGVQMALAEVESYDVSLGIVIKQWISRQSAQCIRLLYLHFSEDRSLADIARLEGVSRSAISQRLKGILDRARIDLQGLVRINN